MGLVAGAGALGSAIAGGIGALGSGLAAGGLSGLVGPAIGLAGNLIQGNSAASTASSAANAQVQAAQLASQTQLQMYNQTRSDLQPFMTTGSSALSTLANLFGFGPSGTGVPDPSKITSALTQFPGYQFGLQQGQQALDSDAASRGMTLSGAQLQAAQKFGQNYAMQQAWNPYVSTLSSFANLGENAAAGLGNNGVTAGNNIAQSQLAAGQAQAAGIVGAGNANNQTISQLTNMAQNWWPTSGGGASLAPNSSGFLAPEGVTPEFY